MRIELERTRCISSGNCALVCPEVFGRDENGMVLLLTSEVTAELEDRVEEAADDCPAGVIRLA